MPPNTPKNSGKFMAPVQSGAGPALMALLARRAQGIGSPLNQNTSSPTAIAPASPPPMPSAPGPKPMPSPSAQFSLPASAPIGAPQPPAAPPTVLSPQDQNVSTILKALAGYLDHAQTMNEAQAGIPQ